MTTIVTRAGKGSPLTNAEVDANFTGLAEVQTVTGEPIGHADINASVVSFNEGTRTFTIAPAAISFDVWCKGGNKHTYTSAQTVVIPNTTGLHYIYFDASGVLSTKTSFFTLGEEAPTAYVYWNAVTAKAPYFGDERHGLVLDWQTHEYLHRTRGAAFATGFAASGYTLNGSGAVNSDAQITIDGGTFFDEDLKVQIVSTATPVANTWQQDLSSPARLPVLNLSGSAWVLSTPTDFPFIMGATRPAYNYYNGSTWSMAETANNSFTVSWVLATNNLNYPVLVIPAQTALPGIADAQAATFEQLSLPGFPSVEFRPLYKLIYKVADSYTNSVNTVLYEIYDLRTVTSAGVSAILANNHSNLSSLGNDDHPQYLHVDQVRSTISNSVKSSFFPADTGLVSYFLQTDGAGNRSWAVVDTSSKANTNGSNATGTWPIDISGNAASVSSITSGQVTTALGYTPYNAASNTVLTNANYNSYAPTLTGTGASGTWSITAATANALNTANAYTVNTLTISSTAPRLFFTDTNGYAFSLYNDANIFYLLNNAGSGLIYCDTSGNFTAVGNVTAYSDERLKKNWRPVQEGLVEKLAQVKSGIYDRTDIEATQAGASAQDMQKLLAETVQTGEDGTLSLAYGNAALVAAIELAKQVVELKKEIELLKAK